MPADQPSEFACVAPAEAAKLVKAGTAFIDVRSVLRDRRRRNCVGPRGAAPRGPRAPRPPSCKAASPLLGRVLAGRRMNLQRGPWRARSTFQSDPTAPAATSTRSLCSRQAREAACEKHRRAASHGQVTQPPTLAALPTNRAGAGKVRPRPPDRGLLLRRPSRRSGSRPAAICWLHQAAQCDRRAGSVEQRGPAHHGPRQRRGAAGRALTAVDSRSRGADRWVWRRRLDRRCPAPAWHVC